ncbi:hypothetical protein ZIOFF_050420 [Zingiber officinale]|uniref:Laccase n=1 Tax=Zingiber officinale TaxID=94328 RepID=A0A8J5FJ02_ZINOF|nr:hypothetical protein ZIOFF_050420 [Zingiber officinale]
MASLISSLLVVSILLAVARLSAASTTRHYKFDITMQKVTKLCKSKSIVTVNGQFPGPRIVAREGDRIVVKVVNHVRYNITMHCVHHSVPHPNEPDLRLQLHRNGPERHDVVARPRWFNADPEAIISQALRTGAGPNVSDAFTINGLPGPFYNCSKKDTFKLKVKPGKTYLLRLINAALNDEFFFSIANHSLTVVETDASYVKPLDVDVVLVTPGQTTNVLLRTASAAPNASFLLAIRPYATGQGTFDNTTAVGILEYQNSNGRSSLKNIPLFKPKLPALNDTAYAANYSGRLRRLADAWHPVDVPQAVDRRFFFTVGLGADPCPKNQTCQGPNGTKFAASINNVSFTMPTTALLQEHYQRRPHVYRADFPEEPLFFYNFTGTPPNNTFVEHGTRAVRLPFNTSVEVVLQGTSVLGAESHPMHLHGHNFYVVGRGFGNFDPVDDPSRFNLVDPVERNTVGVPVGGWLAVRFRADNPGVWLMHCHIDAHLSWGLRMTWVVDDGPLPNQKLPPPPSDLPTC